MLRHVTGTITEVIGDNKRAKVKINNVEMTFLNKCGEVLTVGNEVDVYYWTNLANGYIALQHGINDFLGGEITVENAHIADPVRTCEYVTNLTVMEYSFFLAPFWNDNMYNSTDSFCYNGYFVLYEEADLASNKFQIATDASAFDERKEFLETEMSARWKEYVASGVQYAYFEYVCTYYFSYKDSPEESYTLPSANLNSRVYVQRYGASYESNTWKYKYALIFERDTCDYDEDENMTADTSTYEVLYIDSDYQDSEISFIVFSSTDDYYMDYVFNNENDSPPIPSTKSTIPLYFVAVRDNTPCNFGLNKGVAEEKGYTYYHYGVKSSSSAVYSSAYYHFDTKALFSLQEELDYSLGTSIVYYPSDWEVN